MIVVGAPVERRGRAVQRRDRHPPRTGPRAPCPRATCPSTASTTRSASSAPPATWSATSCGSLGETVPFGAELVFACRDLPGFVAARGDLRGPVDADPAEHLRARWPGPPCWPTCRPATSPSARPTTAGMLCEAQSARTISAYVYTAAGLGESTTDVAWDGQALIYENGQLLAESERFADDEQLIVADLDLDRILSDRSSDQQLRRLDPRRPRERLRTHAADRVRAGGARRARSPLRRRVERFPVRAGRTRPAATSAARRSTTSRSGACRRGCWRPGSRRS